MTSGTCRWPLAGALWVAVLLLLAGAPIPAVRAAEALSVDGVTVDVTAESAQAARDRALVEAQRKAFDQLMQRIVQPQDLARVPPVADAQIADMVLDFDIASEQTSTVRYIGTLNFRFDGGMVRNLLGGYNIAYQIPPDMIVLPGGGGATATAGRVVVLPVFSTATESRLFEGGSLWRDAWVRHPPQGGGVDFVVPAGDAQDIAAIDPEQALIGDRDRLSVIAQRYGADTVIVAEARLQKAGEQRVVAVQAQRFGPSGLEDTFRDQVAVAGDDYDPAFLEAVQRIAGHTSGTWKGAAAAAGGAAPAGPEQSIQVAVPIRNLADWLDVQRRLAQVRSVTRTDVRSMRHTEVRLDLYHTGGQDQLVSDLAQSRLVLTPGPAPGWWQLLQGY